MATEFVPADEIGPIEQSNEQKTFSFRFRGDEFKCVTRDDELPSLESWRRAAAANALAEIGYQGPVKLFAPRKTDTLVKKVTPSLIRALKDPDGSVRQAAAKVLGKYGDQRAVVHLQKALKDREARVKWAASEALRSLKQRGDGVSRPERSGPMGPRPPLPPQ